MSVTTFEHPLAKFIRPSAKTTANCPGCGNGILAQSILQAIEELGLRLDDFVFVSGIGCAAWIPSPSFYADVLHTTHGRPIAFGIGVKVALPHKRVMVISGDGDLTAIGGNHLIHAARRNIAMTVFCVNNGIYGMTGGQVAPTTPLGLTTVTTPFGNAENPFDICELVKGAGAPFVARWTTYHPRQLVRTAKKAILKKGFAFVEVLSQCPVEFGRKTGIGNAVQMLEWYKTKSVGVARAKDMPPAELADRIVVGELVDIQKPELIETLDGIRRKAMASAAPRGYSPPPGYPLGVGGGTPPAAGYRVRGMGGGQPVKRTEIRIAGFGGQGVVLAGVLLGTAAAVTDGRRAVQTQSYGAAARGGGARSEVVVSDDPIIYPRVTHPDIMVAMSEEAMKKYGPDMRAGGLLIIDSDLVKEANRDDVRLVAVPASNLATQELGRTIVANIVMLGVVVAKTGVVSAAGMEAAIRENVPPKTIDLNLKAFRKGLELGASAPIQEPAGHATA